MDAPPPPPPSNANRVSGYEGHMLQSTLGHQVPWVPTRTHEDAPSGQRCPTCGGFTTSEELTVWSRAAGWERVRQFRCRGGKTQVHVAPGHGRAPQPQRHACARGAGGSGARLRPSSSPVGQPDSPPCRAEASHSSPAPTRSRGGPRRHARSACSKSAGERGTFLAAPTHRARCSARHTPGRVEVLAQAEGRGAAPGA